MVAQKNEERAEQSERERRKNNIVLHGKREPASDSDSDLEFAMRLIEALHIGQIELKKVERIGQTTGGKMRPIKIEFKSEEEKLKVLTNLRKLKGNTLFDSIHITEDYTYNERKLIRDLNEQAKLKTNQETDSNYIYRVRGSPKNGLFIKRMRKTTPNTPQLLN